MGFYVNTKVLKISNSPIGTLLYKRNDTHCKSVNVEIRYN